MVEAGEACAWYQDRVLRNLTCKRVQVDEIWAFVYEKQKNVSRAKKAPPQAGDAWTWTAIDADTKLIPSWFVGGRDSDAAIIFMDDLASRLANRVQLTSDGHKAYLRHVPAHCHACGKPYPAFLIAVAIAKLPSVPRNILRDIPRPKSSASRDD
jgi:IS1 family transposase